MKKVQKKKNEVWKFTWVSGLIIAIIIGIGMIIAALVLSIVAITRTKVVSSTNSLSIHSFALPAHASRLGENYYFIGSKEFNTKTLHGYAHIYTYETEERVINRVRGLYSNSSYSKPSCFGFISSGSRIRSTMNYGLSTDNSQGIDPSFIHHVINSSMETWNCQSPFKMFGNFDSKIHVDGADDNYPDGKNEILFGTVSPSSAIAVTITWIDISSKEIVEFDQVFNQAYFTFGDAEEFPGVYDLQDIATHELGHALGLTDQTDSKCSDVTMYAFAERGETKKRTLSEPDIQGEREMYGEPTNGICKSKSTVKKNDAYRKTMDFILIIICTLFLI